MRKEQAHFRSICFIKLFLMGTQIVTKVYVCECVYVWWLIFDIKKKLPRHFVFIRGSTLFHLIRTPTLFTTICDTSFWSHWHFSYCIILVHQHWLEPQSATWSTEGVGREQTMWYGLAVISQLLQWLSRESGCEVLMPVGLTFCRLGSFPTDL